MAMASVAAMPPVPPTTSRVPIRTCFSRAWMGWLATSLMLAFTLLGSQPLKAEQPESVDFEKDILPILDGACFKCHSGRSKKPKGDIRLDDVALMRAKSRTDNLVFPRKPEKSLLLKVVSLPAGDDDIMPPADSGKPLAPEQIALIKSWIADGAKFGDWKSAVQKPKPVAVEQEKINPADVTGTARRIDELIEAGLARNNRKPNSAISESLWCRRVYLDLIGRIPTYDEIDSFLRSMDPQKRAKLVDSLLASNGHVSTMFNYWCDVLRARDQLADNVRGDAYLHFIKESIRTNKPYDQWVREMVSPEGNMDQSPATGFYLRDLGNRFASVDNTATIFLGTQIGCAQCHDHPYDEWSRRSYHQFAAWTSGITTDRKDPSASASASMADDSEVTAIKTKLEKISLRRTSSQHRQIENSILMQTFDGLMRGMQRSERMPTFSVHNAPQANGHLPSDYKYPDGQPNAAIPPAVLFGEAHPKTGERPADTFAAWLTAAENPRFATTIANRIWARIFGAPFTGTIESIRPVEDSQNPELTEYLTRLMVATKFDLRQFQRIIVNTRAYARESGTLSGPGAAYDFPGPVLRRMSAEQVWDSMMSLAVPDLDQKINYSAPAPPKEKEALPMEDPDKVVTMVREMAKEEASERFTEMQHQRAHPSSSPKADAFAPAPEFTIGQLLRASELSHPAPESHFLRVFGQSNREVADGGWRAGTVPQTLVMLNSTLFDVLARKGTPFYDAMQRGTGDSDRLHVVYLSILGRLPTMEEMRIITSTMQGTGNTVGIAHTLLGTRQFLFIQ